MWVDHYRYKTVTSLPAKTYIDFLIQWISKQLEKESLFPADKSTTEYRRWIVDSSFPQQYVNKVKSVVKRYFRIYAHIYHSHLNTLKDLKMDTAFLDSLAYFFYFIDVYFLIPLIDLRPLSCAIHQLVPNLNSTWLYNSILLASHTTFNSGRNWNTKATRQDRIASIMCRRKARFPGNQRKSWLFSKFSDRAEWRSWSISDIVSADTLSIGRLDRSEESREEKRGFCK